MADQKQAKVTSTEAIDSFRQSLVIYLSKARRSLDEVSDEVRRTRTWLETEQRLRWEREVKLRMRKLNQAEQELFSAKLSTYNESAAPQKMAVKKAKRAVEEAQERLAHVKKWARAFDSRVEPLAKRLDGVRHTVGHDLPKAVAFLANIQKAIEGYTEVRAPGEAPLSDGDSEEAAGDSAEEGVA